MKLANFDKALHESVKRLARALAGLDDEQGPRGRRLNRNRVSRALGQVKEAVDARFPAPARKPVIRGTRNLNPQSRLKKLKNEGWVVATREQIESAAVAGVVVKRVVFPADPTDKFSTGPAISILIPSWAAAAPNATTMKQLKAARGKGRKGMLVDISLKRTTA